MQRVFSENVVRINIMESKLTNSISSKQCQETNKDAVPESDISFLKFPVSRHLLKLFYDELHSFSTFFALNFDKKLRAKYHLTGTTQMSCLYSKKEINTTQVTTDLYP
jgi:hypothetical protein